MSAIPKLVDEFHRRGWVTLTGILGSEALNSFISAINGGLESSGSGVLLQDQASWPRGKQRRIFEVLPQAKSVSDTHWVALRSGLAATLDMLLSPGEWELPLNKPELLHVKTSDSSPHCSDGEVPVRHWYCPVTFPEDDAGTFAAALSHAAEAAAFLADDGGAGDPLRPASLSAGSLADSRESAEAAAATGELPCRGARRALQCAAFDEVELLGPLTAANAHSRWQPVNRRRVLNRGWHIDVGPGFPNDAQRSLHGDYRQGVVVLVLLTDSPPGAGGTVMLPGSHEWVLRRLAAATAEGAAMTAEALNAWCVDVMRRATGEGRVLLPCPCGGGAVPKCSHIEPMPGSADSEGLRLESSAGIDRVPAVEHCCTARAPAAASTVFEPGPKPGPGAGTENWNGRGPLTIDCTAAAAPALAHAMRARSRDESSSSTVTHGVSLSPLSTSIPSPASAASASASATAPASVSVSVAVSACASALPSPLATPRSGSSRGAARAAAFVPPCPDGDRYDAPCGVPPLLHLEQIVGKAGDVVLMHPLLLHSGTTNCAPRPAVRMLANGMARLRQDAWAARAAERGGAGCPILERDLARLGIVAALGSDSWRVEGGPGGVSSSVQPVCGASRDVTAAGHASRVSDGGEAVTLARE